MQTEPSTPLTLDARRSADFVGLSERAFHELRQRPDFPRPIELLTAKRPRWRTADLRRYIDSRPEITNGNAEPTRLAAARAKANDGGGLR